MLGIRAALKEDLQASPAEMIYGEPIRLPGEFLQKSSAEKNDSSSFIQDLRRRIQKLQPQTVRQHGQRAVFEYKNMNETIHVFIRYDAPTRALQPTYDGPYEVMQRNPKFFKLMIGAKTSNISIDRLKPAYILTEETSIPSAMLTQQPKIAQDVLNETAIRTESGKISKPPVRFKNPAFKQRRGGSASEVHREFKRTGDALYGAHLIADECCEKCGCATINGSLAMKFREARA
ncbi:uncharacterized protein LOC116852194 [Odontomachus brunneus]|uniref:uncharacterized protein LOC116852194 n=1 Tax=Odontomachus brunneus TaxID=486640 RepID=UPI0013F1C957|nr:uncharacterized protein LOC116852194 [Odontomachus brunneus]